MKMADGGFRPAYNVQFATDVETQIIVGVSLDNQGTDAGHLEPMDPDRDPYKPLPGDASGVADWRIRMGTEAAKQAYTQRAATAGCVNCHRSQTSATFC